MNSYRQNVSLMGRQYCVGVLIGLVLTYFFMIRPRNAVNRVFVVLMRVKFHELIN